MTKFQLYTIQAGNNDIEIKNEDDYSLWYECWLDGFNTAKHVEVDDGEDEIDLKRGLKMINEKDKKWIDNASYEQLLRRWRFRSFDEIFHGETGSYYAKVMAKKRKETGDNGVSASKRIGWDK